MNNKPIGVFDSGMGGLTVVRNLINFLPNEDIIYLGDTARVPYGSHDKKTIISYAKQDLQFLLSKDVKAILVACGTVSSTSIPSLREMTNIPIYGIITPAATVAATVSKTKKVGVLATKATIKSHAYKLEIEKIDNRIEVYEIACPLFVPLIENGYHEVDNSVLNMVVSDYLNQLNKDIDTIILGCTHYPIIAETIKNHILNVNIVDAGREAAAYFSYYLMKKGLLNSFSDIGKKTYYASEVTTEFKKMCQVFIGENENIPIILQCDLVT